MRDRHYFNRNRVASRRKRLQETLENIEIDLLRKARQNWQEWEDTVTVPWSKTIH